MAGKISLEIVTPERIVLSEENAEMVVSPGELGDFGVLEGHTPFLTSLRTGSLRYLTKDGQEKIVFIKGGFAEALPKKVTILADAAETKENIDLQRAEEARKRAEMRLNADMPDEKTDFERARSALRRAEARIKVALL
ncbi:MAG: F0F1 ATP synthase subunit epsilon [Desulfobacteraceae bacterium]|nr:F0F1 ATP synthase subunit epsilon [Desulfobacteraceae bacterium]MCB9494500.1 F0F1 ATP synthase subunit epsilon [Desulfobacteraceae bacterium]